MTHSEGLSTDKKSLQKLAVIAYVAGTSSGKKIISQPDIGQISNDPWEIFESIKLKQIQQLKLLQHCSIELEACSFFRIPSNSAQNHTFTYGYVRTHSEARFHVSSSLVQLKSFP